MKCIIVDDEALARKLLQSYAEKAGLQVLATFPNAVEALQFLRNNSPDLMFLDINMPDLSGMELLRSLDKHPLTIMTTAYSDYALESFELDVVDYLKKPYSFERFLKAVNKAHDRRAPQETASNSIDYFFVKSEYQLVKIKYSSLKYIQGLGEYVKLHTEEKLVVSLLSLSKLIKELPSHEFIRIHKSYIINLSHIDAYQNNNVSIGDIEIPVGQTHKAKLLAALKDRGVF